MLGTKARSLVARHLASGSALCCLFSSPRPPDQLRSSGETSRAAAARSLIVPPSGSSQAQGLPKRNFLGSLNLCVWHCEASEYGQHILKDNVGKTNASGRVHGPVHLAILKAPPGMIQTERVLPSVNVGRKESHLSGQLQGGGGT